MMNYYVDGEGFTSPEDVAQYIADNIDSDLYDDFLDDCYEPIEIFGCEYSPSYAWQRIDPIAYDCGESDWRNGVYEDALYDIEHYQLTDIYGFDIEYEEIPEPEETLAQFLGRKLLPRK